MRTRLEVKTLMRICTFSLTYAQGLLIYGHLKRDGNHYYPLKKYKNIVKSNRRTSNTFGSGLVITIPHRTIQYNWKEL